jgi:hypothetical protein
MGVGIVFRNHEGEVVAAKCSTKTHIVDQQISETVVVWTAALFIGQLGLIMLFLRGFSKGVVQSLRGEEISWAPAGHLLDSGRSEDHTRKMQILENTACP